MRNQRWQVGALLFGSGFCALVYQVAWFRDFRLIFGASTAASAAVLAIFIGGLGVGSLLLGSRADRHPRPLLFYSHLETIIAISAAASPILLMLVRQIYLASGGSMRLGIALSTIVRLVLSVAVLAVPTIAMGGTLPAAARGVTRSGDVRRHDVALIYALNTLGAVAGCVLATFFLLELLGTHTTLWLAAAINLLVAMFARQVDRAWAGGVDRAGEAGWVDGAGRVDTLSPAPPALPAPPAPPAPPALPALPARPAQAFVLLASATVGFAFFLMELVWYRLLAPLLGGSVFTFGLVLALALVGIGIGGLLYTLTAGDRPATLAGFATSCLVEALAVAGTFALGDRVALLTLALLPLRVASFEAQVAGWTLVATLVVLPPAVVAGYQFPMLIALLGRGRERIGRQVGLAYAANTFGAIVGSLAGGFGLLPWLSASGAWRLVTVVLTLLGLAGVALAWRQRAASDGQSWRSGRLLAPQLLTAIATLALLASAGPTAVWRHGGIGAGRAPTYALNSPNELESWKQTMRGWVEWDGDGVESSVALAFDPSGYAFLVNGKSDGSARADAGTQVMLGLVGGFRQPRPRTAMVVGLGTGSTAGWLAGIPSMERVDAVELEPLVLDVAKACESTNLGAMSNPKVRVIIADAREMLLTTGQRYDIIASEPSNPFRAGIASLFTQEFYRAASDRLSEDGVFAQWVQGYEIDAPTLRTIYATMASVFPQVETWQTLRHDLVLLGSKRPKPYSGRALSTLVTQEPYKSALPWAWRAKDVNALLAHYVANDALARSIAGAPRVEINTDDRNIVEFGLARSVGRSASSIILELRRLARQLGADRPPLDDAEGISWSAVDTALVSYNASEDAFDDLPASAPEEELARQRALVRYYQSGDVAGARALWRQQPGAPRDLTELAMVAEIEAEGGSDDALPYIERLAIDQPGEAGTLLTTLRLRQGRFAEAASALETTLTRMRTDPWPALRYKQKAINMADAIAARDPASARRLFDALQHSFAVRAAEGARLAAAAGLSRRIDFPGLCGGPIGAMEPFAPWNAFILTLRRDCYQANGDRRLAAATRDLQRFYSREAVPLGTGLPPAKP